MRLSRAMPVCIVTVAAFMGARAAAEDDGTLACPQCWTVQKGEKCATDGTPLVGAELVGFHLAIAQHSMAAEVAPGIKNPLVALGKADGTVDTERLKKLTADYEAACKKVKFTTTKTKLTSAEDTGEKLSFNPLSKDNGNWWEGDWSLLVGTASTNGKEEKVARFARVTKVDGDAVSLEVIWQCGDQVSRATTKLSLKTPPGLATFFGTGLPGLTGAKYTVSGVTDDARKIGGLSLVMKKVSLVANHDGHDVKLKAWVSDGVACGLVALEGGGLKLDLVCACADDRSAYGQRPEDVLSSCGFLPLLYECTPGESAPLPFHPLANAKPGDWCATKQTLTMGDKTDSTVIGYTVLEEADAVAVEALSTSNRFKARFDAKKVPDAFEYLGRVMKGDTRAGTRLARVKLADEKRKLGDNEVACKKVTLLVVERTSIAYVTLWVSQDVKGLGLVGAEVKIREENGEGAFTIEVLGYGSKDKTDWGKTAAELQKK